MKARDIKNELLKDYEEEIGHYREVVRAREKWVQDGIARIRVIESQLSKFFGISKKFETGGK